MQRGQLQYIVHYSKFYPLWTEQPTTFLTEGVMEEGILTRQEPESFNKFNY